MMLVVRTYRSVSKVLNASRFHVAAVAVALIALIAATPPAAAAPAHRMTLLPNMHTCDFQLVTSQYGHTGAQLSAQIDSDGRTATAHIDMFNGADNALYVVRMIPAPHGPLGCQAGDPGIATATLATDEWGAGNITITAPVSAGVRGLWLAVDLPSAHSQMPREFFSSDFVAPV